MHGLAHWPARQSHSQVYSANITAKALGEGIIPTLCHSQSYGSDVDLGLSSGFIVPCMSDLGRRRLTSVLICVEEMSIITLNCVGKIQRETHTRQIKITSFQESSCFGPRARTRLVRSAQASPLTRYACSNTEGHPV